MRLSNAEMEFCRELGRDAAAMVAAAWPQYANEITRVQDLCDLVARGILAGTRRKGEPLPIDGLQMLRSLLAEMVSRRAGSMLTVTWMNDELGVPITPTDTRNDLQQSRDAARQLLAVLDRSAFDAMKRFPGPIPATPCPLMAIKKCMQCSALCASTALGRFRRPCNDSLPWQSLPSCAIRRSLVQGQTPRPPKLPAG